MKILLLIAATCSCLAIAKVVFAEQANFPSAEADGVYVNPAETYLSTAPTSYYAIYGRYPSSWQAVRDAGLIQVSLYANDDFPAITPDDSNLDGAGDRLYVFRGEQSGPQLGELAEDRLQAYLTFPEGSTRTTWDELFTGTLEKGSYDAATQQRISALVGNEDMQRLLGLASLLRQGVNLYNQVHGHYPVSWQEYISSGLAPIGTGATNPLTGGVLYGDGRPNNVYYERNEYGFKLWPIDADGNAVWTGSYL